MSLANQHFLLSLGFPFSKKNINQYQNPYRKPRHKNEYGEEARSMQYRNGQTNKRKNKTSHPKKTVDKFSPVLHPSFHSDNKNNNTDKGEKTCQYRHDQNIQIDITACIGISKLQYQHQTNNNE
jgi:hypothetical protein